LHSLRARAAGLKKYALNAGKNQFAHRAAVRGGLRFELAVQGRGDIDRGADGILLHKRYYPMCAINMERAFLFRAKTQMICRCELFRQEEGCNKNWDCENPN
jgi:hypothetical protein